MLRDDMIMKLGIVHIMDSAVGMPVLSDQPIDMGSNLCDFLKGHIEKFTESDDIKHCQFSEDSEVMELIKGCHADNFVETSKALCEKLYAIMNSNIDIPAADVAVVVFGCEGIDYFGFLKLNYKTSYTHATKATEEGGNLNDIILQKAILPSMGQKLTEAFLVNLSNGEIILTEKKYDINGEKKNYFSEMFLECHAPMSQKTKLDIVTRAVEQVNKKYYGDDDTERKMEIKKAIYEELEEKGSLAVEEVKEKVFKNSPEMQADLEEKLEKYNMVNEVVEPKSEATIKKFQKQRLTTDTGIEITIPMEEYGDPDKVEFITNEDGTISVLIKNIGRLSTK
ncbi:MAG: nucleoid-associated protein [Lachnospiraceae bacterium]|nr:nucleoid-associated protein [Lachnospiraceae bacterium]